MGESKQINEIAELLKSARTDIVNKNFAAAVEAINVALDELEVMDHGSPPSRG